MKDLVIDADIMRASGTTEHPVSNNARLILEMVREKGHRLVQTRALKAEHDKHQSRFAATWRGSMVARKQWVLIDVPEDVGLRERLAVPQNPESAKDEAAVLKDAHLLEAAAASGNRVISNDTTAKQLFQKACPLPAPHGRILWADTTAHPEEGVRWVEGDCPEWPDWRICPRTVNPAR